MSDRTARRKRVRTIAGAVVVLAAAATIVVRGSGGFRGAAGASGGGQSAAVKRVVPEGVRIKVEVFNATDTRGLARAAMLTLRDAGFDVVYSGNTSERHDSTIVRDRSGHADWAALARGVMAPATVEAKADSGRLVDLSVLVGSLWRAPTEPFRP